MSQWGINLDKRRTRPPVQRERVLADLRAQILSGRYAPGSALPTRVELRNRYAVSTVTLQRAMNVLTAQGFVVSDSRGTVVTSRLPHLCRYGLVYPGRDTADFPWGRFYRALHQAATAMERELDVELPVFYCGEHGRPDTRDYRVLAHIVSSRAIAGLFLLNPYYLKGTPVLRQKEIPLVCLESKHLSGVPVFAFDRGDYRRRAIAHFAEQERTRPAFITAGEFWKDQASAYALELATYGMEFRRQWVQNVSLESPEWARNTAHLLFANPQDRPDALLIADDNLVEHATLGLIDAGVRSPQEVTVIGHCNFPFPPETHVPLSLLGYDCREVLKRMIAVVERCREQGPVGGEPILIPTRFDDEQIRRNTP